MRDPRPELLLSLALLVLQAHGFELQDTIHSLMEENIHLHDQLENLTHALRELGRIIWHHSNDPDHHHDEDAQHLWSEGMSAETHLLLAHALCGRDPHSAAPSLHKDVTLLLLLASACLCSLLLACF